MSLEEEEVKTYSELIVKIRSRLLSEMDKWVSLFRRAVEGLSFQGLRVELKPSLLEDRVVGAVDGGSMVIPFADRLVGVASALAVKAEADGEFERKLIEPRILLQSPDESDGDFADRLDIEREVMVISLGRSQLPEVDLLIVDGPLILNVI